MFAIQKYSGIGEVNVPQKESESEIVLESAYIKYQSIFIDLLLLKRHCENSILKHKFNYMFAAVENSIVSTIFENKNFISPQQKLIQNNIKRFTDFIAFNNSIESTLNLIFDRYIIFKETAQKFLLDDTIGYIGHLYFNSTSEKEIDKILYDVLYMKCNSACPYKFNSD